MPMMHGCSADPRAARRAALGSPERLVVVVEALLEQLGLARIGDHRAVPLLAGHVLQSLEALPHGDQHELAAGRSDAPRVSADEPRLAVDERNRDLRQKLDGFSSAAGPRPGSEDVNDPQWSPLNTTPRTIAGETTL